MPPPPHGKPFVPQETLFTFTHRSPNVDRHLEKPNIHAEWGVVSPAQLIRRPGSHPDVHQQACVETGRGCFTSTPYSIHPQRQAQPPCWQSQAFSQTINSTFSQKMHNTEGKKSSEVWFHRFFPTTIFKAKNDTTLGNKHLLGCVCSSKGLVLLPCPWRIRRFNTVLLDEGV